MQLCRYLNILISKYSSKASLKICKNVSMKNKNHACFQVFDNAIMWICQVNQYVIIHR